MTIPELLVRDGKWPTVDGPYRSKNNPVWCVEVGDWIPKDQWYKWAHKIGGPKGYQASLMIYFPSDQPKGTKACFDYEQCELVYKGDIYESPELMG